VKIRDWMSLEGGKHVKNKRGLGKGEGYIS